jgi:hypothetical protein
MVFKIFDMPAGGTVLWSSAQMPVRVANGLFNVAFEGVSIDAFSGTNRYLAVYVDGAELTERKGLVSVPYALKADFAEKTKVADELSSGPVNPLEESIRTGWKILGNKLIKIIGGRVRKVR